MGQVRHILFFGSEGSLASARAQELKAQLEASGAKVHAYSSLPKLKEAGGAKWPLSWAVLVSSDELPMPLAPWQAFFNGLAQMPSLALLAEGDMGDLLKELKPQVVVKGQEPFEALLNAITGVSPAAGLVNNEATASSTAMLPDPAEAIVSATNTGFEDYDDERLKELTNPQFVLPQVPVGDAPPALSVESAGIDLGAVDLGAVEVGQMDLGDVAAQANPVEELMNDAPVAVDFAQQAPVATSEDEENAVIEREIDALSANADLQAAPTVLSGQSGESWGGGENFGDGGAASGGGEMDTLRRYAALKEREAREKEAASTVLKKQLEQLRDRMMRSEKERRRLTMALEDAETRVRALEDQRDSHKHHLTKLEQQHLDEMRALQLRLDNAQFQATRAEKKLEDFRERVRQDIMKIRARERELANKLELQKRDAEALLANKDERLLQQKREMERGQYELELLKERMLEETQKAEDRAARLIRAVKSLKLAQGMLAGMEEEVLPQAASKLADKLKDQSSGEGEAA